MQRTKADRVAEIYAALVGVDPRFVEVSYREFRLKRHPRQVVGFSASTDVAEDALPGGEFVTYQGAVCRTRGAALESLRRAIEKEAFSRYVRLRNLFG